MANIAKKFSLNDWADEYGLTTPTVDALTEEKLVELEVLTELTEDDILGSSMLSQLSLGERLRLCRALAGLCTGVTQEAPPVEPGTIPNRPAATADIAADGDIREKLRQFEMESDRLAELFGGMGMTEPATVQSTGKPKSKGPNKCYSVIDFVSFANATHGDEETELLSDNNGTSIIMKNSRRNPKIQEVTLSQWVSANTRIMSKLIADGTLSDTRDLLDYLEYTSRVGDLEQTHTVPSVMLFDNKFRQDQAAEGSRWSEYNWHACLFHLEKRASGNSAKQPAKRRASTRTTTDKSGNFICLDYNNESGCQRTVCRYSHVCAEEGCQAAHPQYQHGAKHP